MSSESIALFQPPLGGPSDDEVAAAKLVIAARHEAIETQRRETLLRCTSQIATGQGCGEMSRLGNLTYIQTHVYVEPSGCSGGDYWRLGEGQWACPRCGHVNRLYASPAIEQMKHSFRVVEDRHDG